ncbi:FecR family protein [Saprospiraceae bacterium]|nr:FecR family protein [Saprospiraceae bacterium]
MTSTEDKILTLLAANSSNELSANSMSAISDWKNQSSANENLLDALSFIEENRSEFASYNTFTPQNGKSKFSYWIVGLLLVLAVLSIVGFTISDKYSEQDLQFAFLNDQSEVHLFDGAKIEMVAGFGEGHRTVHLTGNAYFDVSHNEALPFTIIQDDIKIEVLGTAFTVHEGAKNTKVSVYDGKVKLSNAQNDYMFLTAGEAGIADGNEVKSTLDFVENENLVTKAYKDINVYEILIDLKINYGFEVRFSENVINSDCYYNGSFQNASFSEILEEFALIFKLEFHLENQGVYIQNLSCK